jgi:hypothetical protein
MGKNNQQRQAEGRAKAVSPKPAIEQPKQEPTAALAQPAQATTPAAQPNKQEQTIAKLRDAWVAKGVDLSNLAIKDDGKFKLVVVADNWPTISIGPTGGISVLELRSYASAFDAAVNGLDLYTKQKARDAKKSAPAAATAPAPNPAPAKPESTTQRKKRQDAAVEAKLETASA